MEVATPRARWILPLILLGHVALVGWFSAILGVWIDESFTLETTSGSLATTIKQSLNFEGQPPFYFIVIWFLRFISDSVFFLRGFSIACSVGVLVTLAQIVRRLFPDLHPAWVVGLAAFNPITIYAASELRVVAFSMLLSAVLVLLFIDGFLAASPRKFAVIAYGVVSVIAVYTHYYLGFLLFANGVALLLTRRRKPIVAYYVTMAVVAVCIAPLAAVVSGQMSIHSHHAITDHGSYLKGVRFMVERTQKLVLPSLGFGLTNKSRWIFPGILAAGVGAGLFFRRTRISQTLLVFYASTAVAMLLFAIVVWRLGWELMAARHVVGLLVPAYVCLYAVICLYEGAQRRRILWAWIAVAAFCSALSLYRANHQLAKPGDWKRVARHIEANEQPNEPVLVFPSTGLGPLKYHYRGINELVPLPRPESFETYNTEDHAIQNDAEIITALETAPDRGRSLWVAINCDPEGCFWLGLDYRMDRLESFLDARYSLDSEEQYFGTRLQRRTELAADRSTE